MLCGRDCKLNILLMLILIVALSSFSHEPHILYTLANCASCHLKFAPYHWEKRNN